MINLGLAAADHRALLAALVDIGTKIRVHVEIRNFAGETIADVSDRLIDGQVDIDAGADITRALSMTLTDPKRHLPFDSKHPAKTALFFDRTIRARYDVLLPGNQWVEIPVFTGPVTRLNRTGALVNVEARGKEVFFLGAAWQITALRKHLQKTDALTRILTEGNPFYAEGRLAIPDLDARLPHHIGITRDAQLWKIARNIARSMDRQLFYDARGIATLRTHPDHVRFTFTGAHRVVTDPVITYDEDTANAAIVKGANPKGPKNQIIAFALPRPSHPLHPRNIGRVTLATGQIIEDSTIKKQADAQARADRALRDAIRQGTDVQFDSVPVPLLDPLDLCSVHTDDLHAVFRLGQSSLPLVLTGDVVMHVGYRKRITTHRAHGRHDRHKPPRKGHG